MSATVASPENDTPRSRISRLPGVTGPSTSMTRNPAKPPVSGPAMLQTNVPPRSLTANPKSEAEGIVVPRIGFPIRPAPTTDASRSSSSAFAAHTAVATSSVANANTAPAKRMRLLICIVPPYAGPAVFRPARRFPADRARELVVVLPSHVKDRTIRVDPGRGRLPVPEVHETLCRCDAFEHGVRRGELRAFPTARAAHRAADACGR